MSDNKYIWDFRPLSLLDNFINTYKTGRLEVWSNAFSWWLYFKNGKLIYASHASERSLVYSLNGLKYRLRIINPQALCEFERYSSNLLTIEPKDDRFIRYFEYHIICWLFHKKHLGSLQVTDFIEQSTRETLESFLSLKKGKVKIVEQMPEIHAFCELSPRTAIEYCQTRLQSWKSLAPLILSPHQRPCIANRDAFFNGGYSNDISLKLKDKLVHILQGYSIRHVAALLKQDELNMAKFLYPYVRNQSIVLRAPEPPFNQLFGTESFPSGAVPRQTTTTDSFSPPTQASTSGKSQNSHIVIACVDDSPNTLNQIERFLGKENFLVFKFLEPIKATFQLRQIKPDIILIDLTMPKINGYELCQMLRNLPGLEKVPVVVVTSRKGIIDRARAKLVGATDYLEKPFTQKNLLDVISKNLT